MFSKHEIDIHSIYFFWRTFRVVLPKKCFGVPARAWTLEMRVPEDEMLKFLKKKNKNEATIQRPKFSHHARDIPEIFKF